MTILLINITELQNSFPPNNVKDNDKIESLFPFSYDQAIGSIDEDKCNNWNPRKVKAMWAKTGPQM